jgi:single-strand DNA-binding protein
MASLNRVFLIGNLTRDPELRYTSSGLAVADLRLAVSERFRDRSGEMQERTCFLDVTVWDRQAQTCAEYLSKGSPLMVEGSLQMDEWQAQDGAKRSKLFVRAQRTQFLGRGPDEGGSGGGGGGGGYDRGRDEEDAPPPRSRPAPSSAPADSGPESNSNGASDDDDLPF